MPDFSVCQVASPVSAPTLLSVLAPAAVVHIVSRVRVKTRIRLKFVFNSFEQIMADPTQQKGAAKTARIPIKIVPQPRMRLPSWIRAKSPNLPNVGRLKGILREDKLHTVCEEASCPNLGECFGHGTATFMILGDLCTRRCPFCDVGHGTPLPPDVDEPRHLAETIALMALKYVVITSVDRDDLRDAAPPDVMNHNLETVPRRYKAARPGADYAHSLKLLKDFKARHPDIPTKSGLMLGLGETDEEILQVMRDLRAHDADMLTLGQYLQPSQHHLPVLRFVTPERFARFEQEALAMGFKHAACGPMVRSSYHADRQAAGV